MRKLYPLLISLIVGILPAYSNEVDEKKEAEMLQLLESKIDMSKPPNRGEQMFVYLLDENGKQVADVTGLQLKNFSEGLATFSVDVKINAGGVFIPTFGQTESGFIDVTSKKVIPAQFNQCGNFSEGLAWCLDKSNKFSYIDRTGKKVFTLENWCICGEFSDGLAAFNPAKIEKSKDEQEKIILGKWGFIDKTGKTVIDAKYELVKEFSHGRAAVKLDDKWFFIDKNGKQFGDIYDKAISFSESLAAVRTQSKWGYIDPSGKLVIPQTFDDAQKFSEGLASVRVGNLVGFIDRAGKTVIEPQFKDTFPFTQGLAAVKNASDSWGFIDKSGKVIIEPAFDDANSFSCSRALVKKGFEYGYVDLQGNYVVKPQFVFARPYSDNRAVVTDKNWNHPIARGMLMGMHLKDIKIHKDSKSFSGVYIPVSFEDALKELDEILPPAAKHDIQVIQQAEMINYHHGFGTWLRNNWGLWKGGALSQDMQKRGFTHPDDMSGTIFDSYWLKVHGKPIDLKAESDHYKEFWNQAKNLTKRELDKIPSKKLPSPK
ncbi:MAG: WG repeat-containing protein [Candidatus Melainabacteria bacterium]|nr:MAG: WG repeat-containing protein [Candidatus Melainabacteria bacterium]